ncbi:MAG: hypothetical protein HYV97_05115 [Bdellovibrio sp.]|nr:hypothetical protein [Bdellovibrio sp.]
MSKQSENSNETRVDNLISKWKKINNILAFLVKYWFLILPLFLFILIGFKFKSIAYERVKTFFEVDSCLDSGGCWDKVDNTCRKKEVNAQELCNRKSK